jgi:N-acetylglucosaminyl-diphospho-decaprenol L-rhamnosyltransferase
MSKIAGLQDILMSIIIVNYNSGDLLKKCVDSLIDSLDVNFEVIVYDNCSHDASLAGLDNLVVLYPMISIIRGKENLGFAKANNRAAKQASGKFLHFLNPDIMVDRALNLEYRKIGTSLDSSIWVTGLTDATGILQKNRHVIPRIGNISRYIVRSGKVAYWNIGASVMIHKDAFIKLGGWPEDYFMYAEDLDFFYTAHVQGIDVNYLPASVIHIGQGVTHKVWDEEQRAAIVEKSFRNFYRKYGAGWEYFIIRPIQLGYMLFNEPASFPLYAKIFFKSLLNK